MSLTYSILLADTIVSFVIQNGLLSTVLQNYGHGGGTSNLRCFTRVSATTCLAEQRHSQFRFFRGSHGSHQQFHLTFVSFFGGAGGETFNFRFTLDILVPVRLTPCSPVFPNSRVCSDAHRVAASIIFIYARLPRFRRP